MFLLEATRGILPERVPVSLIAILAVWIILALPAVALPAAPEIFLEEEPETYLVIDKLEGMGFPPGLMTGDRGLEARVKVGEGGDESPPPCDEKAPLPLRRRPVILYVEGGGEDQSGSGVPSRWAWMGGVFLPSIGAMKKADLRIEFADNLDFNSQRHHPGVWYQHGQYPHRYRGQILGHHMGTDARDLFIETHYFFLPTSYLELNADITQRDFPGSERED